MAKAPDKSDLRALRNLIFGANELLSTTELPEGRSQRAHELLDAAIKLVDQLIATAPAPAAARLGKKGGLQTAKRGPDYYRQIAGKRKTRGGGRPRKQS